MAFGPAVSVELLSRLGDLAVKVVADCKEVFELSGLDKRGGVKLDAFPLIVTSRSGEPERRAPGYSPGRT